MPTHSEPVLILDPAMLMDSVLSPDGEESDYEYEYDDRETETFYLNLDLTSSHGPIRPPRRRNVSKTTTPLTPTLSGSTPASILDSRDDVNATMIASTEVVNSPTERVQILGLHTRNPIISYHNQIFSCSWADQVGTELLFTRPESESTPDSQEDTSQPRMDSLMQGKDFDLIAANSVKILGRRANLISNAGPTQHVICSDAGSYLTPGINRGTGPQTNQARFLDRLKSIKKAKGETDTVRTVFSLKRTQNLEERLRGWARTEEQLAEIQRLNGAALQGNPEAIAELENLYDQLGSQDAVPFEGPFQQH
ncbi:hypothetical protein BDV25DRAFT_167260 [Aspergillus avenaceus]|uniref:Transcription factor TFIIIC triple barrel domain-containing protein n=1 Tax=Aspergillus avenaceus TaxID=36643 RepID=A0A5N6TCZ8_ASPAV|nr:hypothetical protein BDV25DRAFT_167260 [Aspergillus avenaceus]